MNSSVIGQPMMRIDGRLKVVWGAAYAAERPLKKVAYGARKA